MPFAEGFDHATILVRDLEQASATFRNLGFALTPKGVHEAAGSANHVMNFGAEYLEILTINQETPINAHMVAMLASREGVHLAAARTKDVAAVKAHLDQLGAPSMGPVPVARKVKLPGGDEQEAMFEVLVPIPPGEAADLTFFFSEHKTPELTLVAEADGHPNGAIGVLSLEAPVANLSEWTAHLERILGADGVEKSGASTTVRSGSAPITYVDRASWPYGAASGKITIGTRDLNAAREALKRGGVGFDDNPDMLSVNAEAACGVRLEFRLR